MSSLNNKRKTLNNQEIMEGEIMKDLG
jgi:hypothetical protein